VALNYPKNINYIAFFFGCIINAFSYNTIQTFLVTFILYLFFLSLLNIYLSKKKFQIFYFNYFFNIFILISSISSLYLNQFSDEVQLKSDQLSFFEISSSYSIGMNIDEIQESYENALPIIIWRYFYEFFSFIGIERIRYIGVLVNLVSICFSLILWIRIICNTFYNVYIIKNFAFWASICGILWLFATSHLRDSFVVLFISINIFFYQKVIINKITISKIIILILLSFISAYIFYYLRREYVYFPVLFLICYILSIYFIKFTTKKFLFILIFLIFIIFLIFNFLNTNEIFNFIFHENQTYADKSNESNSINSLGNKYVVNQPFLFRIIFGSIYLLFYPIPIWSGFQLNYVHHLFFSINAIFTYLTFPAFLCTVYTIFKKKKNIISSFVLFNLLLFCINTFFVAFTSLENRHYGSFILSYIFILSFTNLNGLQERKMYFKLLFFELFFSLLVHMAWFSLK
jgi:hypothetical protein